jgi:beta-glucanase (GH16 family)
MRSYAPSTISRAAFASLLLTIASACNPLKESNCGPDPALGKTVSVDFTKGASSDFSTTGGPVTYDPVKGAVLSVTAPGIAPTLISNWYILFGQMTIVMQTAPSTGMISSAILQSDDLDEIDWEILGHTPTVAQTNFFGKGLTTSYDREQDVTATTSQTAFNTYTIDWNADRIIWSVNGVAERTLTSDYVASSDDAGQYPQTPMQVKIGPWAGGDPGTNQPGTVTWAGGEIDWTMGPFDMYVKSLTVTDYSTGSEYAYPASGFTGDYTQLRAVNGAIGAHNTAGNGIVESSPVSSGSASSSSQVRSTSTLNNPVYLPRTSTASINTASQEPAHTGYPWVPLYATSTLNTALTTPTSFVSHPIMQASSACSHLPSFLLTLTALSLAFAMNVI